MRRRSEKEILDFLTVTSLQADFYPLQLGEQAGPFFPIGLLCMRWSAVALPLVGSWREALAGTGGYLFIRVLAAHRFGP